MCKYLLYSVVEVFKLERPSAPRRAVVELDEEGSVVKIPVPGFTAVTPMESKRTVIY